MSGFQTYSGLSKFGITNIQTCIKPTMSGDCYFLEFFTSSGDSNTIQHWGILHDLPNDECNITYNHSDTHTDSLSIPIIMNKRNKFDSALILNHPLAQYSKKQLPLSSIHGTAWIIHMLGVSYIHMYN
jgi:hypothetical protein